MNSLSVTCQELITYYIVLAFDGVNPIKVHNYCNQASESSVGFRCFTIQSPVQLFANHGIHLALKVPTIADRYRLNAPSGGSVFIVYIGGNKKDLSLSTNQLVVPFYQYSDVRLKMTRISSARNPPDYMCEEDPDYDNAKCIANCVDASGAFCQNYSCVPSFLLHT